MTALPVRPYFNLLKYQQLAVNMKTEETILLMGKDWILCGNTILIQNRPEIICCLNTVLNVMAAFVCFFIHFNRKNKS